MNDEATSESEMDIEAVEVIDGAPDLQAIAAQDLLDESLR
jgi:hypothetical protein